MAGPCLWEGACNTWPVYEIKCFCMLRVDWSFKPLRLYQCSFGIGPSGPLWMRWYNRRSAEQELDEFGDGVHKFITLSLSWTNKKLQCKIVSSWDLESETDHYLKHVLQIAEGMNSSRISPPTLPWGSEHVAIRFWLWLGNWGASRRKCLKLAQVASM